MQTVVIPDDQLDGTASTRSRLSSLIEQHPLASFFVLAYAISWLLWLPLVVSGDSSPSGLGLVLLLLGSLVPSTIAILLVAVLHGGAGVRKLLHRLLIWRVGVGWWVAIVLVSTLALGAVALSVLLGGQSPDVTVTIPGAVALFVFFLFPGSAGGEEIGWRGFALPHLQAARSALGASLVLGVVWGVWHLPLYLVGTDIRPLSLFAPWIVLTVAVSVIYTWIYNGTRREPADGGAVSCGVQPALDGLLRAPGERRPGHSALPDLCRADGPRGCGRGDCRGPGDPVPHPRQADCRTVTRSSATESMWR